MTSFDVSLPGVAWLAARFVLGLAGLVPAGFALKSPRAASARLFAGLPGTVLAGPARDLPHDPSAN